MAAYLTKVDGTMSLTQVSSPLARSASTHSVDEYATVKSPLPVRIALIAGSIITLCVTVILGANLLIARTYNSATEQLKDNISLFNQDERDLDALANAQSAVDEQFSQAQTLGWLQLPGLKDSVTHNASVSHRLTQKINDAMKESSAAQSAADSSSSDTSSSSSQDSSNTTDTTDSSQTDTDTSTQERLKTLMDNNSFNEQNYEPQAPKTTTKKPW